MKPCHGWTSRGAPALRLLPAVAALLVAPAVPAGAGGAAAPDRPPSKPYTLYTGADLSLEWQGKLWPVRGVRRDSFVIEADGKPIVVRDTDLKMKITSTLKMTTAYATITAVKAERAYTPASDPRHHTREATALADDATWDFALANASVNNLQTVYSIEQARDATWDPRLGPPPPDSVSSADIAAASGVMDRRMAQLYSNVDSVGDASLREQVELDRQLFDAFRLSFEISAPRPLADPYLVVMVRFREKPDDPRTARLLVYGQVLPAIGEKPQTVRMYRAGFPQGYGLEDYQVHLYDGGTEIATNAAPKQMALTRDEAFQFSVVDYLGQNRGKTLPPVPSKAFWPEDLGTRLPAKKLNRPLFVKVGEDGRASGFFDDEGCTRPVDDPELDAVRPDLRFHPAVANGKAVEGIAAVNLGQRIE